MGKNSISTYIMNFIVCSTQKVTKEMIFHESIYIIMCVSIVHKAQ